MDAKTKKSLVNPAVKAQSQRAIVEGLPGLGLLDKAFQDLVENLKGMP